MDAIDEEASVTEQTSRQVTLQQGKDDPMAVEEHESKFRSKFTKDDGPNTRENTFGRSATEEKPDEDLDAREDDTCQKEDQVEDPTPTDKQKEEIRESLPGQMYDSKLREDYMKSKENQANPWNLEGKRQLDRKALFSKPLLADKDEEQENRNPADKSSSVTFDTFLQRKETNS